MFTENIWSRASASRTTSTPTAVDLEEEGSAEEASSGCEPFVGCAGEDGKKGRGESWAEEVEGRKSGIDENKVCDQGNETVPVEEAVAPTQATKTTKAPTEDEDDHTPRQEDQRQRRHLQTQEICNSDGQIIADSEGEDEDEDSQGLKEGMRRVSLYLPSSLKGREKRMSLPYVKSTWPRSRRGSGQVSRQEGDCVLLYMGLLPICVA